MVLVGDADAVLFHELIKRMEGIVVMAMCLCKELKQHLVYNKHLLYEN